MKPHKDSLKRLTFDHSKFYTVIIETNTPEMVNFNKCDKISNLIVDSKLFNEYFTIKSFIKILFRKLCPPNN